MAQIRDFYFDSSNSINRIHAVRWLPDSGEPAAVLLIAHGVAEHIVRYDPFAQHLAENGIAVYGNDHLGHGGSYSTDSEKGFFAEEKGWGFVVRDMHRLADIARSEFPDVPVFLLGHSMGSFLARTYLIKYPGELDGCILSGTGWQPAAVCAMGLAVCKAEKARLGPRGRSGLVNNLCFGGYNKRIENPATSHDWLSRDASVVQKYVSDSDCGFICTVSQTADMLGGIKYICDKKNISKMDITTPVFFISGDEDPVGGYGKGVMQTYTAFVMAGCTDVSIKLYPGGRHEMLNETNRCEVYRDILAWINEKM